MTACAHLWIGNNGFFPNIPLDRFSVTCPLIPQATPDDLIEVVTLAISDVNQELTAWQIKQQLSGYDTLASVPNKSMLQLALYQYAVFAFAQMHLLQHEPCARPQEIGKFKQYGEWAIRDMLAAF